MSGTNYGWAGSVADFLQTPQQDIVESLQAHYYQCTGEHANDSHMTAWVDTYKIMQKNLVDIKLLHPTATSWYIVFEYELPRERGRRPDVIVLTNTAMFVMEFKGYAYIETGHVDQVRAYVRDLVAYHSATDVYKGAVVPILVLARGQNIRLAQGTVQIVSGNFLADVISTMHTRGQRRTDTLANWVDGEYQPLPSLVDAARIIFRHEPFPQIRQAASSGINDALAYAMDVAKQAEARHERHILFLTGVPGAGKTLVGIRFVYEYIAQQQRGSHDAVMLSGNGPLVKVLQHALKNRVFVQDVHGFLKEYTRPNGRLPQEHIIIYDEAQRAWDAARSAEKRNTSRSEPDDFLIIGSRQSDWAMMIALIGQGQEIHLGEEAGLTQWDDALAFVSEQYGTRWIAHAPPRLASVFSSAVHVVAHARLDLDVSLRAHVASDVQNWVALLLNQTTARLVEDGPTAAMPTTFPQLNAYAQSMREQGYTLYLTRDLATAKSYVATRYADAPDKRYGLVASSKAKCLMQFGVPNEFQVNRMLREGPWFNDDAASPHSCRQLTSVATEFQCQGLELDMPIVCWGDDVWYANGAWQTAISSRSHARDPRKLRLNAYRVLLSRGRDGMILYVPPIPRLTPTYALLLQAGCLPLDPHDHPSEPATYAAAL
ncbi:MAG: hypothetical protein RLY87_453 [Chloroflexota bacterium]|jgi:hypothetical protein